MKIARAWMIGVAGALGACGGEVPKDLCEPAMLDDLPELERRVDAGAPIDAPCAPADRDRPGTALATAVHWNRANVVRWLLDHGASPDAAGPDGETPLLQAVESGDVRIATTLLIAGATVGGEAGRRLLERAWGSEIEKWLVPELWRRGAPVDRRGADGLLPIHHAAETQDASVVAWLVEEREVAVDATAEDGSTALMHAAERGRADVVAKLLALGASVRTARADGKTALQLASTPEVDRALREAGATGENAFATSALEVPPPPAPAPSEPTP